jgi:hypothetical protein
MEIVQKLGLATVMQVRCGLSAGQLTQKLVSASARKLAFNRTEWPYQISQSIFKVRHSVVLPYS